EAGGVGKLQYESERRRRGTFLPHEGVFIIRYPPANPKIKSGDHAAINGGSWLTLPMASNRLEVRTYVTPMTSATTTPLRAPRRPPESAKGTASTAITSVIRGKAIFFCNWTRRRTTSNPPCCRS